MFIKKLLLCLCVVSVFLFNQADAGLREDLSKKKYDFSEPVLDEIEAFKVMIAELDKADEVFTLIWEDVCQGNEKIQLKLFQWFSNPNMYKAIQNKVPLLSANSKLYSLDNLIKIAIKQEKSWAFYQKALKENNAQKKFSLLNQAINNIVSTNNKLIASIYSERDTIKIDSFSVPIPTVSDSVAKNKKDELNLSNYKKNEIEKFISCCKKNKNGGLLIFLYEDYKDQNEYFSSECLKAACELNHVGAILNCGNNCHAKNDVDGAYCWFLKAAEKGNVTSMFNVGMILKNKQTKMNKLEALKWFLRAAEEGEVDAMYEAGIILRKIGSESVDQIKAFNLLKVSSENGQLDSMNSLAEMYLEGLDIIGCNVEEAAKLFLSSAEEENANGMYLYGLLLKKGFMNQEPNINKGNEWILKAAKKGCVAAMNHYGGVLMGWVENVKEPSRKAGYNWFLKAAESGDNASMFNVGEMLWWGCGGVKQNRQHAKEWLLKSSNKGCVDAMIVLAAHLLGEVSEENFSFEQKEALLKEAVRLLKLAYDSHYFDNLFNTELTDLFVVKENMLTSINKGNFRLKLSDRSLFRLKIKDKIIALINFAKLYCEGYVDGQKNIQKAIELILPLAKDNDPEAMDFMGRAFLASDGNELNHHKAAKWYKRAAENGYEPSMIKFAKLVILSSYLNKSDDNLKEAFFWLQKAESLGMDEARDYLEMCEKLLKENAELEVSDNDILEKNDISNHSNVDFKQLDAPIELQEIKIDVSQNNIIDLFESDDCSINVDFTDENNIIVDNEFDSIKSLNIVDKNVQQSKNPKYIREQLRKLAELKKEQQNNNNAEKKDLSAKNQLIVNMLLDKNIKFKNIDYTQLVNFFNDPFFENQVSIVKSKSGCVITGKNYKTLDYVVASTHKKHGQTYDGLNPFFARDLIKVLALFDIN
jgi:uncharacterized protein